MINKFLNNERSEKKTRELREKRMGEREEKRSRRRMRMRLIIRGVVSGFDVDAANSLCFCFFPPGLTRCGDSTSRDQPSFVKTIAGV